MNLNKTAFLYDERIFWHTTRDAVLYIPPQGNLQPVTGLGHVENAENKRRFLSLVHVSGLMEHLHTPRTTPISYKTARLVHTENYLQKIIKLSEQQGGEAGFGATFGHKGYQYACVSAGLATCALQTVLHTKHTTAYALTRPPGHHAESDKGIGFCLLANIAIAIRYAQQTQPDLRILVLDWDVHHGNGTQNAFYNTDQVLTISLHQNDLFPRTSGAVADVGSGAGYGYNINIPLPAGTGDGGYEYALQTLFIPAVEKFKPDVIAVASGYDAGWTDPLGRMMVTRQGFTKMTQIVQSASGICNNRIMLTHEGGYCLHYTPICAYATLETLAGKDMHIQDDFYQDYKNLPDLKCMPHQQQVIDTIYKTHPFFKI